MDNKQKRVSEPKITHWNANDLSYQKLKELKQFIYDHKIGVMLVSESYHKTEKNAKQIENFDSFFKNRNREHASGGVIVYVRKNLHASEIQCNLPNENLEVVGIKLKELNIFCLYAPDKKLDKNSLNKLFNTNHQVMIAGDLNSKQQDWNCNHSNPNDRTLKDYLTNKPHVLIPPDGHTHFPQNGNKPSTIDLQIVKNIRNVHVQVINELDSDNLPTFVDLNSKIKIHKNQTFLNYK